MHISWLGGTAIKLQAKSRTQDVSIVIDPYKPTKGSFPRSLSPHIALFTHGEKDSVTLSGTPFTLSSPGECETSDVLITGIHGESEQHTLYRLDLEHMSVGHLGAATKEITNTQLEALSGVDILFVPVGGKDMYTASQAMKAVNAIEPRIIIPMAFKSDNNPDFADVADFLKEMGSANIDPEKKVIIKKKDLPQEQTQVIVLEKE